MLFPSVEHGAQLELMPFVACSFPDDAFSGWHLHWPILNLCSFLCLCAKAYHAVSPMNNTLFRLKPSMKH